MEKDVSKKHCLADNERYADLINGLLLGGEQQVKAEDLQDMDTQGLGVLAWLGKRRGNYRLLYHDLVRKAAMGVNFLVVGVENQELDEDAYDMAVQYTGATELIAVKKDYENGGKVNMCKALTEMLADERQEGIEQGIEQGKEKALFSLMKKGLISEEQAAEELGVSVGEIKKLLGNWW